MERCGFLCPQFLLKSINPMIMQCPQICQWNRNCRPDDQPHQSPNKIHSSYHTAPDSLLRTVFRDFRLLSARLHGLSTVYCGVAVTVFFVTSSSFRRTSQPTHACAELFETPSDSASS